MLEVYRDFVENDLAIPVIAGKTEKEKFAGALRTYSIEALMVTVKRCSSTSHNLGEHFAGVFDITYLDKDRIKICGKLPGCFYA